MKNYKDLYLDLIMQVARKFPDEERHDTAKRYIIEAENKPLKIGSYEKAKAS